MKIKNISCQQFAGLRDKNVSFEDGVNVLVGKNESGKSTVVNLLSRVLFQNAEVGKKSSSDREFRELYFPGAKKNGFEAGDCADGKITIETERGDYILTKEWSAQDSRCVLSTPDGVVKDSEKISDILKDVLVYGEGVFSDMLLSSQRSADEALRTVLNPRENTDAKQEITDVVTKAFSQSGGVSAEVIEQAILERIDYIGGRHWDDKRDMPVRTVGRWKVKLGEILKAYYALEDAQGILSERERLTLLADKASQNYKKCEADFLEAQKNYTDFSSQYAKLSAIDERKKSLARCEAELKKADFVLSDWPDAKNKYRIAVGLHREKLQRELLDLYLSAKSARDAVLRIGSGSDMQFDDGDVLKVRKAEAMVQRLENSLFGVNIRAEIETFGNNRAEIRSVRSGEQIPASDGFAQINEAVEITVPGVLAVKLSPGSVDLSEVKRKLATLSAGIKAIFDKYGVKDLDELERLSEKVKADRAESLRLNERLGLLLQSGGFKSFEELESAASKVSGDIRGKNEILSDIKNLCDGSDAAEFAVAKKTVLSGYERDYESLENLSDKRSKLAAEVDELKKALSEVPCVPEEYLKIRDPKQYLETLKTDSEERKADFDEAIREKTAAVTRLEAFEESLDDDPVEKAQSALKAFEEQKSLLAHWKNIYNVFCEQREKLSGNPMKDIADSFCGYLEIVSGGRVTSELSERSRLDIKIFSGDNALDYKKLSEGTKETVSLAFRLAVLDHLFPDGGGVIVLDDPFVNMDAERVERSCELVKECAKRHQVILLTCKEEIAGKLGGNILKI